MSKEKPKAQKPKAVKKRKAPKNQELAKMKEARNKSIKPAVKKVLPKNLTKIQKVNLCQRVFKGMEENGWNLAEALRKIPNAPKTGAFKNWIKEYDLMTGYAHAREGFQIYSIRKMEEINKLQPEDFKYNSKTGETTLDSAKITHKKNLVDFEKWKLQLSHPETNEKKTITVEGNEEAPVYVAAIQIIKPSE
mgnify:CR=1 FL=1